MTCPHPPEHREIGEAAQQAIATLIGDIEPGAVLTRFVLITETISTDGQRGVWINVPPDQPPWDDLGLIAFADARLRASITADEMNDREG